MSKFLNINNKKDFDTSEVYRVGVNFEEGFSVKVKANSKEEARQKVFDMVDEYGACTISDKVPKYHDKNVHHRDWTVYLEEKKENE